MAGSQPSDLPVQKAFKRGFAMNPKYEARQRYAPLATDSWLEASSQTQSPIAALKSLLRQHPVISHEFLNAFRHGHLSKAHVKFWTVQQFFFSISLPSAFAALYARIPDHLWKKKRELVELLKVEAWGSKESGGHSGHFREFAEFLGIDLDQIQSSDARPYTRRYIEARLRMCLSPHGHLGGGLAAIGLGNEALNLYIFEAYREGIHKIPGLERCPTGYLDAHLRDEGDDSRVFLNLYEELVDTETEHEAARRSLLELLDMRVTFLDELSADLAGINS